MHVLLVNPNRIRPPVAPLALDSLGQALATRGISCSVADLCMDLPPDTEPPAGYWNRFSRPRPSAVLVTLRNLDDAYYASRKTFLPGYRDLVGTLRARFGAPVIAGGCAFSLAPEKILAYLDADLGVAGASEHDLLALLGSLEGKGGSGRFDGLPGIVWKEGGTIRSVPPTDPAMNEDFFSQRRFVRNRDYFEFGGMAGLETKRGCGAGCVYCADPVAKGRRVFLKPMEFLLSEIRSLLSLGVTVFHLCDSEFNLPVSHAFEVCDAILAEGLSDRIRWYTYAAPETFDESLAFRMAEAGCAGVNFGADHCLDKNLAALGRRHTSADLERTARAARAAGIPFLFDLLLGGPGETLSSLLEAVEFCRDLDVERVGVSAGVRVYPNTPLARRILSEGPLEANPSLRGILAGNEDLLLPVFFLSADLDPAWEEELGRRVGQDQRFFLPGGCRRSESNYNYNANEVLVRALEKGHKGAFWDILRRIQKGLPALAPPGGPLEHGP